LTAINIGRKKGIQTLLINHLTIHVYTSNEKQIHFENPSIDKLLPPDPASKSSL
jgi:hypothetical protein